MKLFLLTSRKAVVRIFGFAFFVSLLIPPLVSAGVTVRFSGEPSGEGVLQCLCRTSNCIKTCYVKTY
jgi:hypothetical protein